MRNNEELFTPQVLLEAYQAQYSGQSKHPSQSGTSSRSGTSASLSELDYAELAEMYQAAQLKAGKVPTDPLHDALNPVIVKMAKKRVIEIEDKTGFQFDFQDLVSEIWADLMDPEKRRFNADLGEVHQYLYGLSLDAKLSLLRATAKQNKFFNWYVDVQAEIPNAVTTVYARDRQLAYEAHAESVIAQVLSEASPRDQEIIDRCSFCGESHSVVALSLGICTKTVQRTMKDFIHTVRTEIDPELVGVADLA